jgi:hypothetical protein
MRITSLLTAAVLLTATHANANDIRTGQDMFPETARGAWTQVLLGLTQLGVAKAAWPALEREERALVQAEKQLAYLRAAPVTEAQRIDRIAALGRAIALTEQSNIPSVRGAGISAYAELADELTYLSQNPAVSAEQKAKMIRESEEEIARLADNALVASRERGLLAKGLRFLRIGSSVLIAGDALTRVYVWNVMEANPTLSPLGNLSWQAISGLWR